jgi:hypothetical protein
MPGLARLIGGLMRLGNGLLAIFDRCWRDSFCVRRTGLSWTEAIRFETIGGECHAHS